MLYETLPDDMGCLYTYMHTEIVVQHICDEVVRVSFLGFLSTLCSTTCVPFYVHPKKSAGKSIRIYSPENQHVPWKSMVGRCIPYWNGPFSGDMLVFWGVEYRTSKTWEWTRSPNLLWSTWIVPSDLQRKQLVCRRCSAFFRFANCFSFDVSAINLGVATNNKKYSILCDGTSGWSNVTLATISCFQQFHRRNQCAELFQLVSHRSWLKTMSL